MTRIDIIDRLKKYFQIYELVSEEVYNKYKEDSWALFHEDALHCLLIMREGIDKPFTINNWYWGGNFDERGFRENTCSICKSKTDNNIMYLSGHVLGMAFDFTVRGMNAPAVRDWIEENADLFPCKIRLENEKNGVQITWVHFDIKFYDRHPKVYRFDV
jgi:hypothetical protein